MSCMKSLILNGNLYNLEEKMKNINLDELKETLQGIAEIKNVLGITGDAINKERNANFKHPMIGRRCILRTYSAGVHIGLVKEINPDNNREALIVDALRLWSWSDGGLSLSAIANKGVVKARLNKTGEIYLTEIIEYIPTTELAEETFLKFIEE